MPKETGSRHKFGELWSHPSFMRLWAGQSVSLLGTFAGQLVFPLVAVITLDATPVELGIISASQFFPVLLITVAAGYWLDRVPRRPVLIGANLLRALILAAAIALIATGTLEIWKWCLLAFLLGSCTAVFDVAWHAYMPSVVDRTQLVEANAKLQTTYAVTQILGTALGGVLLKILSPILAFAWNIVAYLASSFFFASIGTREVRRSLQPDSESLVTRLTYGFRFIWLDRPLRMMMLSGAWFNFCEQALLTLFLIFGIRNLGLDSALLGVAIGLGSIGATAGALVAKRLGTTLGIQRTMVITMGLTAVAPLIIPLNQHGGVGAVVAIIVAFNVYGLGQTVFNIFSVSLRQERTPDGAMGRVSAAFRTVAFGALPLGALIGGLLGEVVGVHAAIFVVVGLFVLGWVAFIAFAAPWLSPEALNQAGRRETHEGDHVERDSTV